MPKELLIHSSGSAILRGDLSLCPPLTSVLFRLLRRAARYHLPLLLLPALIALGVLPAAAQETAETPKTLKVRIIYQRDMDPTQYVQWHILELALKKSGQPYDLARSTMPTAPERSQRQLTLYGDEGNIFWGGITPSREIEALVVNVPILRGLWQYQYLWVREDQLPRFEGLETMEDLAKFHVIQGPKWSTIPAFNLYGITPVEGDTDNMPAMVARGRADVLPLSLFDTPLARRKSLEEAGLTPVPGVMLVLPTDHFFVLDRNNQALHDALEEGLLRSFEDGSYAELLRTHPTVKDLFDGLDLDNVRLIHMENPNLTPNARAAIEKYAVRPDEIFGEAAAN